MNRHERRAAAAKQRIRSMPGQNALAHPMVLSTAKDLAESVFEQWALSNANYALTKEAEPGFRERWVQMQIPAYLGEARKALGMALASPILTVEQKDQIQEALEMDASLLRGPGGARLAPGSTH